MADQDKHNKTADEKTEMETTVNGEMIREIYESLDIAIDRNNTSIKDLSSLTTAVGLNTAKTGITTAQANAITANTAKTGITTAQAKAITENTAKVGITTAQASAITSATSDINTINAGRVSGIMTTVKNVTAQITQTVVVNSKTGAATLNKSILLSNGVRYTSTETLTKVSK